MFYFIPIEPLEERYSKQWYAWFPEELERRAIPYTIIDGEELSSKVECGTFLDINSTVHYKAEQIKKISKLFFEKKIKNGDKFFISDLEFWGIETIKYLADLNNISVGIYGFLHAASYTKGDFIAKCSPYGRFFERGWASICDKVFVGTYYHKKQFEKLRLGGKESSKIIVTGNPYDISSIDSSIKNTKKINQVILTNRPDFEKRPNISLDIFRILKERHPDWSFVATTSRDTWGSTWIRELGLEAQKKGVLEIKEGLTKNEYLKELSKSKVMVSNTIEENFGYCVLESCIVNTIPIIENRYSHPELVNYDERCLFDSIPEQLAKIEEAMKKPFMVTQYADKYSNSLSTIIDQCL